MEINLPQDIWALTNNQLNTYFYEHDICILTKNRKTLGSRQMIKLRYSDDNSSQGK